MSNTKESHVQWLGEVPKNWRTLKVKFLCNINTGSKDTQDKLPDGKYPFFVRSPHVESLDEFTHDEEAIMTAGDGAGVGKVFHYYEGKFAAHQRVYVFTKFKDIIGKYLYYYLMSNLKFEVLMGGAKSTVDSIRRPMLSEFPVVFPDLELQKKIVRFLDRKIKQVNDLISLKQKYVELIEEQRQSIITEAVTKGLNPNVKMKDTGVEWIGEIPEHWDMKKIKYLIQEKLSYGANESAELDDENLPRYIRITDIDELGNLKEETFKSLPLEIANNYVVKKGDVLLARSGATVGKSYIHKEEKEASYAGYLIKLRARTLNLAEYIYYFTNSSLYKQWINSILIQATIQNVSAEKYANLSIPVPNNENEIKSIVTHIKLKEKELLVVIEKLKEQIEKLKEYRQALIYEAVTGKIDVRDMELD